MNALGIEVTPEFEAEVRRLHLDPPRAYHDFQHVTEVLSHLEWAHGQAPFSAPADVVAAALFHDCIYRPGEKGNEAKSVDVAKALLPTHLPTADLTNVARLIMLTAKHGRHQPAEFAADADAARFLDADMAILGAGPARFSEYEKAIRQEFRHFNDFLYGINRRAFLSRLLASERIFLTEAFVTRFEATAKANLARALSHPTGS